MPDLRYDKFTFKVNVERSDGLDITYKNKKIERICTDAKVADRTYGNEMAEKIHMRIDEISAADTVEMMIQFHKYPLSFLVGGNPLLLGGGRSPVDFQTSTLAFDIFLYSG